MMKGKWVVGAMSVVMVLAVSQAFAVPVPIGPWQMESGTMSTPAQGFGSAAIGGYIYAMGGEAPGPYGNSVAQRYDPVADSWSSIASMPTARHSLGCAVVDGFIYAIAGHVFNSRSENERYDPATNMWTTMAPKPTAVSGPGVTAYDGKVYTFGGNSYGSYQSVIEVYDPNTNSWQNVGNMPATGEPWDAAAMGDRIYLAGGVLGGSSSNFWSYDPNTGSWDTSLPTLNQPRSGNKLVAAGGWLFAIGGRYDGSYLDSVECWRPGDTSWTQCNSLNIARPQAGAATIEDNLYAFGGYDASGNCDSIETATIPGTAYDLGDMNGDGLVNAQDINPFVLALTDTAAWVAQYPQLDLLAVGDIGGSGQTEPPFTPDGYCNAQDITPFVYLLTHLPPGGAGDILVPEPATVGLLGMGALGLLLRRRRS